MRENYIIITNNPLVVKKAEGRKIIYKETSYEGLLKEVRSYIHGGRKLLTHPLSGSVKPNETPYKSVLVSEKQGQPDAMSLELIEHAIEACAKFTIRADKRDAKVLADFQLIDWTLIQSAIMSAEM